MKVGILVVSMVLLISIIPLNNTTEAQTNEIYGWVVDQSNDNAIKDVKVTLFDPDDGQIKTATTDQFGAFSIYTAPGHYMIQYSHSRYITSTYPLQMNDGEENLRTIALTKINAADASLTGHVEDTDGNSGKYAYVYLIDTDGTHDGEDLFGESQANTIMTRADSKGDYQFPDVYAGTFDLVVRLGNSRYNFGGQTSITLVAGANAATPDLVFTDWGTGSSMYIKPFNSDSQKITNAEIIFYDPATNMWNSTSPSPGGVTIPDGTYDLIVRAPGYQTHIEQVVVSGGRQMDVDLVDSDDTVTTTDITFTDWQTASYQSNIVTQFDHGPMYRSNDYMLFNSGIIRYDVDRIFGNGDASLSAGEIASYEIFLDTTIGSDGERTGELFDITNFDFGISNYDVGLTMGASDVRSTDTITYDFSYDLTSTIDDGVTSYQVDYQMNSRAMSIDSPAVMEFTENATFNLPPMYEVVSEDNTGNQYHYIHHDEDDTTIVFIDGNYVPGKSGFAEFMARENVLPEPIIDVTNDFVPGDDMFIFRANEFIEFNGSNSYDSSPFGKILSYDWTFENETGGNNNTMAAIRSFSEGIYTVTLKVTDNAGGFAEKQIVIIVDDTLPTVDFSFEPTMVDQGSVANDMTRLFLNITTLTDANGIFSKFNWDLGDGTFNNITVWDNRNITDFYAVLDADKLTGAGDNEYEYTVGLTVWDNAGNENTVTHVVTVNNTKRPEAHFFLSDDLVNDQWHVYKVNEVITFNASESAGNGYEITGYSWDFKDDGTEDATEMTVNHSFATAGMYNAVLTVTDEVGGTGTYNVTIYIDDQAPTVTFAFVGVYELDGNYYVDQKNDTNAVEQYLVNITAEGTKDNGVVGDLLGLHNFSYEFEEPNKPGLEGLVNENISHIATLYEYSFINSSAMNITIGNNTFYYYTITLTVWDKAGNSASFSRDIIVNDTHAPVAKFSYPEDIDEGTAGELNATKSTDNIGIADYTWIVEDPDGEFHNFTNGNMIENMTFDMDGDYIVTLIVTDEKGNTDEHESVVKIGRIPRADLMVDSDGIFYSKDTLYKDDTTQIIANITNVGDMIAHNISVEFYFRTSLNGTETLIGIYDIPDIVAPSEVRLANVSYKVKDSGQVVVKVIVGKDPEGIQQIDDDLENNEAFQNIFIEDKDDETNWGVIIVVVLIVVIIAAAVIVFLYFPEWVGINKAPVKSGKSSKGKK